MNNVNKVLITGNVTRSPELRYTQKGMAVTDLPLASNRRYRNADGELKEETTFVDVTLFGKQAETAVEYLTKGRPVFIDGRLRLERWEDNEGTKKRRLKIIGERFNFLSKKRVDSE